MSDKLPSAATQLEFLSKLQRILHEGQFVASYKFALTLALAELAVEKSPAGDGALSIPLHELSERFIALYWNQTAPFAGGAVLAQSTGLPAASITLITRFRKEKASTLASARRHPQWLVLVRRVARLLNEMPLWRLQTVGADKLDFLYEKPLVDGAVVLKPGVAAFFRQQFGVVQALVQMGWLAFIQGLPANREILGARRDLSNFLFGTDRTALRSILEGLRDLQGGGCFYCAARFTTEIDVDHFIPWSRYPRDLGHNFVLAHRGCNQNKGDMLAAPAHLERWVKRNREGETHLREIFANARFLLDADASFSVTEWAYDQAQRANSLVWLRGRQTSKLTPEWREWFR